MVEDGRERAGKGAGKRRGGREREEAKEGGRQPEIGKHFLSPVCVMRRRMIMHLNDGKLARTGALPPCCSPHAPLWCVRVGCCCSSPPTAPLFLAA